MTETQSFPLEIKLLSDAGEVEGLAAAFGNADRQGDVIAPGAFSETLLAHRTRRTMPAMLLHHDMKRPIGRWTELAETPSGLVAKGRLAIDTADGLEAHRLLRAGALAGLSIGFRDAKARRGAAGGREIIGLDLLEISFVTVPANPLATVSSVKATPGPREIEAALRATGLSNRQAKAAASAAMKAVSTTPDDDTDIAALAAIFSEARQRIAPYLKGN